MDWHRQGIQLGKMPDFITILQEDRILLPALRLEDFHYADFEVHEKLEQFQCNIVK
jgi:hypothetical protein